VAKQKRDNLYRRSRQRERILELLRSTGSHPTASWIYDRLKGEFPDLSMGTVYRNLNILIEQDLIKKIDFGSTFDRFDANRFPHYHFICERCGSITDLEVPIDETLNRRVGQDTGFSVTRHRIEFYGLCGKCEKMQG
jgi:Fur family peroxide stress response transcriptional regulator